MCDDCKAEFDRALAAQAGDLCRIASALSLDASATVDDVLQKADALTAQAEQIREWQESNAGLRRAKINLETTLLNQRDELAAKDSEIQRLKQELVEARKWKEEDPRMLREQIRVADVAYNHLRTQLAAAKEEIKQWRGHDEEKGRALVRQHNEIIGLRIDLDKANAAAWEMRIALKTIRDDYDCDSDAHKYGTICRCCLADKALSTTCGTSLLQKIEQLRREIVALSERKGHFLGMAYGLSKRAMHDALCPSNLTSLKPTPECDCSLSRISAELKKEMGL